MTRESPCSARKTQHSQIIIINKTYIIITADGDCSHEIKRRLLLERKVMTNLDSM